MGVKTVNLAPMIRKSIEEPGDLLQTKVLAESVDEMNNIISPPIDNTGLKELRNSSIYHRKCLKAVAMDVAMNGYQITSTTETPGEQNKETLKQLFDDYDNSQALLYVMEDFRTYTHAAFEIIRNQRDEIRGFKHIRANTIRMCKGGEHAVQRIGSTTQYFKIYGVRPDEDLHGKIGAWAKKGAISEDNIATEIVWINNTSPDSDYYHEPEYLPAVTTIISDDYLRQYNQNNFRTNGVANYLIMIHGDFETEPDETTGLTFEEDMEAAFREAGNAPGTAVVFTIPTSGSEAGMKVEVTKISDELKEASFEKFRESNMKEILAAHEVPMGRLGISMDGALAGAVDMERNKLYHNRVVKPIQLMLDSVLNKIIRNEQPLGMGITDYVHEFKGLDVRNVASEFDIGLKAVDAGAMKPVELREIITELFKLDNSPGGVDITVVYPELDQFYINRPPTTPTLPEDDIRAIQKSLDDKWVQLIGSDIAQV